MCKFSESNRQKLGNTVVYIVDRARYPYKTEILKLLFLMEERMVQQGIRVTTKRAFCDDEFSANELRVMDDVMKRYGDMNSDQLIAETHKEGSLWRQTVKEAGLLRDFEMKRANTSNVIIDMARGLCLDDREFYEETLNIRESANLMRLERELKEVC